MFSRFRSRLLAGFAAGGLRRRGRLRLTAPLLLAPVLENPLERLAVVRAISRDRVFRLRLARALLLTPLPTGTGLLPARLPIPRATLGTLARLVAGPRTGRVTAGLALAGRARLTARLPLASLAVTRLLALLATALAARALLLVTRAILRAGSLLCSGLISGPSLPPVLRLVAIGGAALVARLRISLPSVTLVGLLVRLFLRSGVAASALIFLFPPVICACPASILLRLAPRAVGRLRFALLATRVAILAAVLLLPAGIRL